MELIKKIEKYEMFFLGFFCGMVGLMLLLLATLYFFLETKHFN